MESERRPRRPQHHRRRPGHQRDAPAVRPMHDDVLAHRRQSLAQGQEHRQFLDRVEAAVGAVQAVDLAEMFQPGRHVLALAEQLARAGVDQDRMAVRTLHEEDAGRQIADQGVQHARGAPQVVGQCSLRRDVGQHALPADQPSVSVQTGDQRVADPANPRRARIGRLRLSGGHLFRQAIFAGDRLDLPADLGDGGANDFPIVGVDALQPALVIAEQFLGRTAEQRFAGGADQRDLGRQTADRQRRSFRATESGAVDDDGQVGHDLPVPFFAAAYPAGRGGHEQGNGALAEQVPLYQRQEGDSGRLALQQQQRQAGGDGDDQGTAAQALPQARPDDQ